MPLRHTHTQRDAGTKLVREWLLLSEGLDVGRIWTLRVAGGVSAWVTAFAVSFVFYRASALAILLLMAVALCFPWVRTRPLAWVSLIGLWAIATLLPFDVTTTNVPGPPRFVPYVTGLPSPITYEQARRGDVVLGGCSTVPWSPARVLVW